MDGSLDQLDCCVVSDIDRVVRRQRYLRNTKCARICLRRGSDNLESAIHDIGVIDRIVAEAQVDVDERTSMALEPARLEGNSTTFDWPFRSVLGHWHTTAGIRPLHTTSELAMQEMLTTELAYPKGYSVPLPVS